VGCCKIREQHVNSNGNSTATMTAATRGAGTATAAAVIRGVVLLENTNS